MTEDERDVRKVVDAWIAATEAGDVEGMLALMTDDVVFLVPGQEPFGKEAFAAASESAREMRIEATSDIREARVVGDMAYMYVHLEVRVTPEGGGVATHRSGPTLSVLRKGDDGRWRIARDANLVTGAT